MKERKTYIVKGKVTGIELRVAYTKEGEKDYAVANIEAVTKNGKPRKVKVLTFYPTGIDFLTMSKEGSKIEAFGTFTKMRGTNGINKFFELIGKHNKQEKLKKPESFPEIS